MTSDIDARAAGIGILILDADGVLTDGSLYYGPEGEALKMFNVRDGAAIKWLQRAGIEVAVLTGRKSPQVDARCKELEIETVIQGAFRKLPAFEEFLKKSGATPDRIAYMGDDLHDLPVMRRVALALAPADAIPAVLEIAHWVAPSRGGHGCVREAAELILKAAGKWDGILAPYME